MWKSWARPLQRERDLKCPCVIMVVYSAFAARLWLGGEKPQTKTQIAHRCFVFFIRALGKIVSLLRTAGSFPSNKTSVWEAVVTVLRKHSGAAR